MRSSHATSAVTAAPARTGIAMAMMPAMIMSTLRIRDHPAARWTALAASLVMGAPFAKSQGQSVLPALRAGGRSGLDGARQRHIDHMLGDEPHLLLVLPHD